MQSAEGRLGLELGLGLVTLGGLPLVPTFLVRNNLVSTEWEDYWERD